MDPLDTRAFVAHLAWDFPKGTRGTVSWHIDHVHKPTKNKNNKINAMRTLFSPLAFNFQNSKISKTIDSSWELPQEMW